MALYEGIALIQEKQAVVLDLGTDYTKFGFTGEAAPRCIIRSEFWCEAERRIKRVHDYETAEELYDNLVHMLHLLYFRHILVNPKERKVIVVESLLTPTLFRETLAKVLYIHYEVSGVVWADSPRLCALTLGTAYALIVSIGAKEAEVTAVVHGCVVMKSLQSVELGAWALHAELRRLLDLDNDTQLHLPEHILEDIKVKTCFVGSLERAQQWESETPPAAARDVQYPVTSSVRASGTVRVSGRTRERAAEVMFVRDNELASLPDAVLQCIVQCPVDVRAGLAASLLVCGGGARLPGLRARLAAALRSPALAAQEPYLSRLHVRTFKFHSAPAHCNATAWLGGALLGAGGPGGAGGVARERYARAHRAYLADWVCLLDNTPPDHPHRRDLAD